MRNSILMQKYIFIGILSAFLGLLSSPLQSRVLNGFDITKALVPENEIFSGGPPRDGIPALTSPKFVHVSKATFLEPKDTIIGINIEGKAKAYPIKILNWHEIVNDKAGQLSFVVTYCPLCGTGMVFDAQVKGKRQIFGVSGLLYNNDVLLYDKETGSLWSQLKMQAITGSFKGTRLKLLPAVHTTWEDWKKRYPQTLVLSKETGYQRDYHRNPYEGYDKSKGIFFPLSKIDRKYHSKTWTFAITNKDQTKLFPFVELFPQGKKKDGLRAVFKESIGGSDFRIEADFHTRKVIVMDAQKRAKPVITGYWFALRAFYPDAQVFSR